MVSSVFCNKVFSMHARVTKFCQRFNIMTTVKVWKPKQKLLFAKQPDTSKEAVQNFAS